MYGVINTSNNGGGASGTNISLASYNSNAGSKLSATKVLKKGEDIGAYLTEYIKKNFDKGGKIFLHEGDYTSKTPIIIENYGVTIEGSGHSTNIVQANDFESSPTVASNIIDARYGGFTVRNLRATASITGFLSTGRYGEFVEAEERQFTCENIYIDKCKVFMTVTSNNTMVHNIQINDCTSKVIRVNKGSNNYFDSIYVRNIDGKDSNLINISDGINNNFSNIKLDFHRESKGKVVDVRKAGLVYFDNIKFPQDKLWNFSDCSSVTIRNTRFSHGPYIAINAWSSTGLDVRNCNFLGDSGVKEYSIDISGGGAGTGGHIIMGNTFFRSKGVKKSINDSTTVIDYNIGIA